MSSPKNTPRRVGGSNLIALKPFERDLQKQ